MLEKNHRMKLASCKRVQKPHFFHVRFPFAIFHSPCFNANATFCFSSRALFNFYTHSTEWLRFRDVHRSGWRACVARNVACAWWRRKKQQHTWQYMEQIFDADLINFLFLCVAIPLHCSHNKNVHPFLPGIMLFRPKQSFNFIYLPFPSYFCNFRFFFCHENLFGIETVSVISNNNLLFTVKSHNRLKRIF